MEKVETKVVVCNLCGQSNAQLLFKNYDRLYQKPGFFNIVRCKKCGLVYLNPRPKDIGRYYPDEYEPYNLSKKDFFVSFLEDLTKSYYQKNKSLKDFCKSWLFEKVYNPLPKQLRGKILDLGCGNGIYLDSLRKFGWDVYGTEVSRKAVIFARKKLRLRNVKFGFLEEQNFPSKFFDVVTLNHVVEHLPDPKKTLREIKRILKKGGLLLITTPNWGSINAKIFKQNWFPLETPRHLYLFTASTLRKLLSIVGGFKIKQIKYDISTYSLGKSLENLFGLKKGKAKFIMKIKMLFLPLTIFQSAIKKSDIMTFYVYKE